MKMIAINKNSVKLKIWGVELPNAPYSNRHIGKEKLKITVKIKDKNSDEIKIEEFLFKKIN